MQPGKQQAVGGFAGAWQCLELCRGGALPGHDAAELYNCSLQHQPQCPYELLVPVSDSACRLTVNDAQHVTRTLHGCVSGGTAPLPVWM